MLPTEAPNYLWEGVMVCDRVRTHARDLYSTCSILIPLGHNYCVCLFVWHLFTGWLHSTCCFVEQTTRSMATAGHWRMPSSWESACTPSQETTPTPCTTFTGETMVSYICMYIASVRTFLCKKSTCTRAKQLEYIRTTEMIYTPCCSIQWAGP